LAPKFKPYYFQGAAFYRGMMSPLFGVAAINAVGFGVYGNVQRRLPDPDSIGSAAVAGMTAGFVQVSLLKLGPKFKSAVNKIGIIAEGRQTGLARLLRP
jgi:hypothetical protein